MAAAVDVIMEEQGDDWSGDDVTAHLYDIAPAEPVQAQPYDQVTGGMEVDEYDVAPRVMQVDGLLRIGSQTWPMLWAEQVPHWSAPGLAAYQPLLVQLAPSMQESSLKQAAPVAAPWRLPVMQALNVELNIEQNEPDAHCQSSVQGDQLGMPPRARQVPSGMLKGPDVWHQVPTTHSALDVQVVPEAAMRLVQTLVMPPMPVPPVVLQNAAAVQLEPSRAPPGTGVLIHSFSQRAPTAARPPQTPPVQVSAPWQKREVVSHVAPTPRLTSTQTPERHFWPKAALPAHWASVEHPLAQA